MWFIMDPISLEKLDFYWLRGTTTPHVTVSVKKRLFGQDVIFYGCLGKDNEIYDGVEQGLILEIDSDYNLNGALTIGG